MIVWGESDRMIPPVYADVWAAAIPGATLITVPETGHMIIAENPAAIAEAVAHFG